jgi:leucyl-tRNA synthetase
VEFADLVLAGKNQDTGHWDLIRERALEYLDTGKIQPELFTDEGITINSDQFNGLSNDEVGEKITKWLAEKGVAKQKTEYKLHDWVYSRQRSWGEPIPIIHCDKCGAVAVPDDQLPVELPVVDHYEPTDDGQSPLSKIETWVNTICPKCGGPAKRETDTMPNWAGSNWYYLRYFDAHNNKVFADSKKLKYWGMVDMYMGGMEHTTLHLLYSRFHHQFLYDQGLVPTPEPYAARRGHGMILAADGTKMSKSKGNVVDPTEIINSGYGADAVRLATVFLAPYDQTTPWNPEGVTGTYRFLSRVWKLVQDVIASTVKQSSSEMLQSRHKTIKKVSESLENQCFNTAIAALMEYLNTLSKDLNQVSREDLETFLQLLAPFAPQIASELYQQLGNNKPIEDSGWPQWDEKYLISDEITIAVQVNGKLRGEVTVAATASEDEIQTAALKNQNVANFIGDKEIKETIYVPNKIINFVI